MLALDRLTEEGHEPVCLITVVSADSGASYMHAASDEVFEEYGRCLGIPMILCRSADRYDIPALMKAFGEAKKLGAEVLATGDIDMPEIKEQNEMIAAKAGFRAMFPLWEMPRREVLDELFRKQYHGIFTVIDGKLRPTELLGRELNEETLKILEAAGVDICGEKGEFHTMVVDGPLFKKPLNLYFKAPRTTADGYVCSTSGVLR